MEPSREAIEAASDTICELVFGRENTDIETAEKKYILNAKHFLKAAYAIDVAPLEKRIAEMEEHCSALIQGNADNAQLMRESYDKRIKDSRNAALVDLEMWISKQTCNGAFSPFPTGLYNKIRSLKEE